MSIVAHAYSFPKDEQHPEEWEDGAGYLVGAASGWFAVADGASSGYRVKEWARQLVGGFLEARPVSPKETQDVLLGQCDLWSEPPEPPPGGPEPEWWEVVAPDRLESAAAFIGVTAHMPASGSGHFRAFAVGDCCLLHVRGTTLHLSFPLSAPQAFGQAPQLVYSRREKAPAQAMWIQFCTGELRRGDMLVLGSDKISQCLLEQSLLSGDEVWQAIRSVDRSSFESLVRELRRQGCLGVDAVTLLRVCVT